MLHLFKIQPEFADISAKKYNKEFAANKQLVSLKKVWGREKKMAATILQPGEKEETHCSSGYYFADEQGWSHGKITLIWYGIFAKCYWPRDDRAHLQRFSWGNI